MAWLIGWNRRKPKLVKGSIAGAQTDYQLKLTVYKGSGIDTVDTIYLGGYVNNDFRDLRFTSSDETTLLPYWIESYTSGVSAIVWVKIDSIPADPFSKFIYIYYDNPVASPGSNGTNTFQFFDDFSINTSGNYSQYNLYGTPAATKSWNSSGYLQFSQSANGWNKLLYNAGIFGKNIAVDCDFRFDSLGYDLNNNGAVGSLIFRTALSTANDGNTGGYERRITAGIPYGATIRNGIDIFIGSYIETYTTGIWYKFTLAGYESTIKFFRDNIEKLSVVNSSYLVSGYVGIETYDAAVSIDNLRVRTYAYPEPIWDQSSPEQTYTANLTVSSTPTGAEIWINNVDQGVTTTGWFIVNPGTYAIMLTKLGYEDYIEIITLESNVNAIVQGNLIPIPSTGDVCIKSNPSGASIIIDGTLQPGKTTAMSGMSCIIDNTVIGLSPGIDNHSYEINLVGYQPQSGTFTITSGLTTILDIPLTPLSCPIVPKYSSNTITLKSTPKDGTGPYYVEFFKDGITIDPLRLVDELGNPTTNPILSAPENTLITRVYTLDDLDIASALLGTIDFSVYMEDSCPTGPMSCTETCTIIIGCLAPVCDFIVT